MGSISHTVSGDIASFKSAARVPITSLKCHFKPVQEGSGDPSPANVRPITGWTGLTAYLNNGLPAEYQPVEYIESTGTQFINTGLIPKFDTGDEFYVRFNLSSVTGTCVFFGTNNQKFDSGRSIQGVCVDGQIRNDLHTSNSWIYFGSASANKWYEYSVSGKFVTCLGKTQPVRTGTTDNTAQLWLFAQGDSQPSTNASCKISTIWYKHNGSYTLYLVPCYRKSDDEIGMYDVVSNTFITNSGTGDFLKGSNDDNARIIPVTFPVTGSSNNTVYGGYVDIAAGEVVAEWKLDYIGNYTYGLNTGLTGIDRFYVGISSFVGVSNYETEIPEFYSSYFKSYPIYPANSELKTWVVAFIAKTAYFYTPAGTYSSASDFKTKLSDIPIVYKIATPIHYPLSKTELTALLGSNSAWSNTNDITDISYAIHDSAPIRAAKRRIAVNEPHIATATGNIANFSTDLASPLKSCKINFSPVQEGTGDPSPSNVRPISGWTGVTGNKAKKNIAHIVGYSAQATSSPTAARYLTNSYGTTISTNDFTSPDTPLVITQSQAPNSTKTHYVNGYISIIDDNLKFGEKYSVSMKISNIISNPLNASLQNLTLTPPYGAQIYPSEIKGDTVIYKMTYGQYSVYPNRHDIGMRICGMSFTLSEVMVTPEDMNDGVFEAYNGTSILIDWTSDAGTVYGGYLDLVNGELVATHQKLICDGTINFNSDQDPNTGLTRVLYPIVNLGGASPALKEQLCPFNYLKSISDSTMAWSGYISSVGNLVCRVPTNVVSTKSEWSTYLSEHPLELIYELATPIHYTLTQQLKSLKGTNNIWSDANGQVEVKYWKH